MILQRNTWYPSIVVVGILVTTLGYLYLLYVLDAGHQLALIALLLSCPAVVVVFFLPRIGFYTLLITAMFNNIFFAVSFGNEASLRPDQLVLLPVFSGVALRVVAESLGRRHSTNLRSRASRLPVIVCIGFVLYITVHALSSFLFSPQPTQSFKIVIWLLLSFLGFVATYFVVGRYLGVREAFFSVLALGFVSAAVGIGTFFFPIFGDKALGLGVSQVDIEAGKFAASGTFYEHNIFGSFQAFSALAGITVLSSGWVRGWVFRWTLFGTALSVVALALSFTRSAWLGFIVGMLIFFLLRLREGRKVIVSILRLGFLTAVSLFAVFSMGVSESLAKRFAEITNFSQGTTAYRIEWYNIAWAEWPSSPFLGLGTNSFGQRHLDPSTGFKPAYLSSLFLSTLYDTGIVGLLILLAVFLIIIGALVQILLRNRNSWRGTLALALLGGLISLLVSYQATSAFWFSYNWIVFAIVLRLYETSSKQERIIQQPSPKRQQARRSVDAFGLGSSAH